MGGDGVQKKVSPFFFEHHPSRVAEELLNKNHLPGTCEQIRFYFPILGFGISLHESV